MFEWTKDTPAFCYDEGQLLADLRCVKEVSSSSSCKLLYSLKACAITGILDLIAPEVDGFATSSTFEAKLAKKILRNDQSIHFTTPGIRPDEVDSLGEICNYITLNSLTQLDLLSEGLLRKNVNLGLRVNPKFPLIRDQRYDPCRQNSKLGVPIEHLTEILAAVPQRLHQIRGLHFHNNCESPDFRGLLATVRHIEANLSPMLENVQWVNMGGGYMFNHASDLEPFFEAVLLLRKNYGLEVFIEPGAAIVRDACFIVARVIDLFSIDDKTIAVVDTTVNHMSEVLDFSYEPEVWGHIEGAKHSYHLVGSTCLAGDVFGDYDFETPLEIGSVVKFPNIGAYSIAKAHMFNGVNLPSVYCLTPSGKLVLKKRFTFEDFLERCEVDDYAAV